MNRWIMNSLLKMMKISNRLRNTQKNKRKSKRRHSKSQKKLSCIKMWHKNIHQALALIFLQKFDNRWRYYLIKNYNKEKKRKKDQMSNSRTNLQEYLAQAEPRNK